MRTILHLSDLHFGRVNYETLEPLLGEVKKINPNVVVVSGDLTQRAKPEEFLEAQNFIKKLPKPRIIVPGNHDVPLYNLFYRLFRPHTRFKKFIAEDLEPFYSDKHMVIVGLNTARGLTHSQGRLSLKQGERAVKLLASLKQNVIKIVVTHHPFYVPEEINYHRPVGRAKKIMTMLAASKPDIFLSGHLHVPHTASSTVQYNIDTHCSLISLAGTATSTRHRSEINSYRVPNSFNVLKISPPHLEIHRYMWEEQKKKFYVATIEKYTHDPITGWSKEVQT